MLAFGLALGRSFANGSRDSTINLDRGVCPCFHQAVVNRSTPATLDADGVPGVVKQDGQVLLADLY